MTQPDERFLAVPCQGYRVGSQAVLLTSSVWEGVRRVTPVEAAVLRLCSGERTLDDHADVVARSANSDSPVEVRQVLVELADAGLLRSSADRLRSTETSAARNHARITTLGIATADRPRQLERCLDSYIGHAGACSRRLQVVVVDGSRDPAHAAANERAIRRHAAQPDIELRYIGEKQQAAFRAELVANGAGKDVVDFALSTRLPCFSAGASRNILLLLTAGEMSLHVDDDTLCTPWAEGTRRTGVDFCGHGDPRHSTFFATRKEAIATAQRADVNLFEEHERVLGQSLLRLLDAAGSDYDVSDACPHLMSAVVEDRSETVRMTLTGIAGDSGEYCPHNILFRGGVTQSWLVSHPEELDLALSSREVSRIVRRQTVTHFNTCMMYCAGLDNRELLPPFLPAGRNEDGVFGATMGLCAPEAFFGHLPYGIVHDSDRLAPSGRLTILSASQSRVSEMLLALVGRYSPSLSRTVEGRMRHLGDYLNDVANADIDQLMRLVTEASLNVHCQHLMMAERAAGADPGHAHWLEAVERHREVFIGNAANPNFFVPVEFQGSAPTPDARLSVQSFLSDYGRLLNAWPDLWEQGKQLAHNSTG